MFAIVLTMVTLEPGGMEGDPLGLIFGLIILALWCLKQIGTPVRR